MKQGDRTGAIETLRKSVALRKDPPTLMSLGRLLTRAERVKEAIKCLEQAVDAPPKSAEAHVPSWEGLAHANRHRAAVVSEGRAGCRGEGRENRVMGCLDGGGWRIGCKSVRRADSRYADAEPPTE